MKTIALLAIGAALALASDQDDKKTNSKPDPKPSSTAATPAKPGRPMAAAASQPAKRNLHQPTVRPAQVKLTPEQQAAAALPQVPPGAKEVGPNLFRSTDAQGKPWMYRKTPFGVSKWEEKPGEQQSGAESPATAPAGTIMTDQIGRAHV